MKYLLTRSTRVNGIIAWESTWENNNRRLRGYIDRRTLAVDDKLGQKSERKVLIFFISCGCNRCA